MTFISDMKKLQRTIKKIERASKNYSSKKITNTKKTASKDLNEMSMEIVPEESENKKYSTSNQSNSNSGCGSLLVIVIPILILVIMKILGG